MKSTNKASKKLSKMLKNPTNFVVFLIEEIHNIPSNNLIMLKQAIDYELLDRKYLQKSSWFERMMNKMR